MQKNTPRIMPESRENLSSKASSLKKQNSGGGGGRLW